MASPLRSVPVRVHATTSFADRHLLGIGIKEAKELYFLAKILVLSIVHTYSKHAKLNHLHFLVLFAAGKRTTKKLIYNNCFTICCKFLIFFIFIICRALPRTPVLLLAQRTKKTALMKYSFLYIIKYKYYFSFIYSKHAKLKHLYFREACQKGENFDKI